MKNKKWIIYTLIILFVFIVNILNISYAQNKVVDAFYKDGLKKYVLGDYKGAIKSFESALKLDPKNIKVQNMYFTTLVKLGNIEYSNGNLPLAKSYYEKALKVSGGNEDIKNKLLEIDKLIGEKSKEEVKVAQATISQVQQESGKKSVEKPKTSTESTVEGKSAEIERPKTIAASSVKEEKTKKVESQKSTVVSSGQVSQVPFNIEDFIARQNEENRKMLESFIKAQKEERKVFIKENQKLVEKIVEEQNKERETLVQHIKNLSNLQREDRKFFSKTLLIIVAGGIAVIVIVIMSVFLLLRRLAKLARMRATTDYPLGLSSESYIKEIPELIDESRLITDERYSDIIKAKRLKQLYLEFKEGDPSWDTIQEYITEVNSDIKNDILDTVEKKLKEGGEYNREEAYKVLLPLITDGDAEIRDRSRQLISKIVGKPVSGYLEYNNSEDSSNPLSIPSLMGMANVADMKTRRPQHSVIVAEISQSIAEVLARTDIDPGEVYKVGLAHDIGYMELPTSIFRKNRNLTEKEFEVIKTHPVRGVNLLSNATKLPQIFVDGIKYHHERMDGSGYPEGLEGNAIPIVARIVAVADFFTAITSSRLYRKAMSIGDAIKMIKSLSDKIFDREIVEILVEIVKKEMERVK